ncbi:hypothetical protein OsJ_25848 [Oryza sativa Japonica Group]|jgi:uncharacterized membrane protein YgcG|uniref:Secreted protein n=1 Tax=Oryza sativa subsp. japonica TaxID=39947 RepID=B9FYT3_ORYSJ|nr:hypothetical protein OsJ_25848 [Oryza sativa Japonica Group]
MLLCLTFVVVRSLAMQSATEKVRRTPSSCLLLCISDICKDAAGHGGGGAGCGRGSGGGGGGRLDGRGGGMGPTVWPAVVAG